MCPRCGSLERHRLLALYLRDAGVLEGRPARILHVAPEDGLERILRALPGIDYVSGDLEDPRAMIRLDVTELPFAEASFDVVICNHVLEHIPDEQRALAEIHRVLRPGGWALLQSALDPMLEETLEDPRIVDPDERTRVFGQRDHVRLYGLDYGERLRAAGFQVTVAAYDRLLGPKAVHRHGLLPGEDIYRCDKPSARPSRHVSRAGAEQKTAVGLTSVRRPV